MTLSRRDVLVSGGALAGTALVGGGQKLSAAITQENSSAPPVSSTPVCLTDFEPLAKTRMSHMAWEYINGAAADQITYGWNREAYDRIKLKPRVLVDVSRLDTSISLLGQNLDFPILLAPTAYHRLVHQQGEIATAQGAKAAGAQMVLSSFSTTAVEEVSKHSGRPLWFQLYSQRDRGFTKSLLQRAEAAGCRAICLTVDTPTLGARNREERINFELPAGLTLPHLQGFSSPVKHRPTANEIYSSILNPELSWKDIESLVSFAKIPLFLKGVLNPDDADRAVKAGVGGIIVSNHGARNLDTVPATIEALPRITDSVAGRIPVLVDGGVRRGTDVLKALANGANAVLIGRPYLYALSVNGADGVAAAIGMLRREFQMAMALTGRTTVSQIDRSVLWS